MLIKKYKLKDEIIKMMLPDVNESYKAFFFLFLLRREHDFKCRLFKDCLRIPGADLSQQNTLPCEAGIGHTWVHTPVFAWLVSAFVCM